MAVFVALLLALTMIPAAGVQSAFADEQFASEGLIYKTVDGGAVLVGFEDSGTLDENVTVPEKVTGGSGELTVVGVDLAEGQAAPGVKALTLSQTVEDVNTKSLAAAMPGLASINVDGTAGVYSSANGLLFKQADEAASSDGSTVRVANRELVWTPPATVIARIPGTCKRVAAGAFTDAAALETIMAFSTVESIARPEKDSDGSVTKEGAFTDEQVSRVNIVIPISATVQPEGTDRISADVFLSEQVGLDVKQTPWCDYGFDMERFTVGIPHGSTSVTVAVSEDGKVGTPEITIGNYIDYPQWNPKPGEVDWPKDGLVFEYKADMTVSVRWDGDKNVIPSHLELPAYVVENGVKTAVTEIAPNAFENAAQLESVVIPEGVTTIGESAFAGCSGLKSASLPSTLKTIDYAAFKGAGLESVDVPSAVRWIGGEAFDESCYDNDSLNLLDVRASSNNTDSTIDSISAYSTEFPPPSQPAALAAGVAEQYNYLDYSFVQAGDFDAVKAKGTHVQMTVWPPEPFYFPDPLTTYSTDALDENGVLWYNSSANGNHYSPTVNSMDYLQQNGILYTVHAGNRGSLSSSFNYANIFYTLNPDGSVCTDTDWRIGSTTGVSVSGSWQGWVSHEDFPTFYASDRSIDVDIDADTYGSASYDASGDTGTYADNVAWTAGENDCGSLSIKVDATRGNSYQTKVTASGDTVTFSDPTGANSSSVKVTPKYGWQCSGDWYIKDKNNPADTGTRIDGQTIDDHKEWVVFRSHTPHTYNINFDPNYADGWVSNSPMGETVTYTVGTEKPLAEPYRDGFWFAGWMWTNSAGAADGDPGASGNDGWSNGAFKEDGTTDTEARQFSIPAGAWGNAHLKAVWKPKMYKVGYNVDATAKKDGSGNMAAALPDGYFVHPAARRVIAEGADNVWTIKSEDAPEMSMVDLSQVNQGGTDNLNYVFAESDMYDKGFLYQGWTNGRVNTGVIPGSDAGAGPWLEFPDTAAGGDAAAGAEDAIEAMFGADWDDDNKEPSGGYNDNNATTLYGVWKRGGEVPITLANTLPDEVADKKVVDGEAMSIGGSTEIDEDTPGQEITYWRNRGLFLYGELLPDNEPDHTTTTPFDKALPEAETKLSIDKLQFKALARHGFRFLGWGKKGAGEDGSDVVFLKYVENGQNEGNVPEFYLTQKGMDYALQWNTTAGASAAKDEGTTDTWDALWEIRTYKVTLRLPAAAVESDSVELVTDPADTSYGWRKEAGANSGWYVAENTWNYYDVIDVPKKKSDGTRYVKKSNFYTYEGWYLTNSWATDYSDPNGEKSLMTEAEGLGSGFRVMARNRDSAGNVTDTNLLFTGTVPEGATAITEVTDTDNTTAPDGACVLWLNFSPVIINVSAPVGVFLASDADGGAYVVGSDPRMHLETEAKFTVKKTTHDLVLTGVTATDIVDAKVGAVDGDASSTPDTVSGIKTSGGEGLCDRMLSVNNPGTDAGDREGDNGSRVFWISPVETVDSYTAGSKDTPGTKNEFTRRYFGFGEGGLSDNTLWDDPDTFTTYDAKGNAVTNAVAGKSENDLSAFKLRMPETVARPGADATIDPTGAYKNDEELRGGLRPVENGEFVDYRFYYGLDLSKCKFDLGEIQRMVESDTSSDPAMKAYDGDYNNGWKYNEDHKTPMLRLMFTFAVERQQFVSYSVRFGDEAPAQDTSVLDSAGLVTVGK